MDVKRCGNELLAQTTIKRSDTATAQSKELHLQRDTQIDVRH
jgi:hypothetical protein